MIRLTALLRRNPDLSPDEFHAHWRDVHAAKILSVPRIREWVVRYEQHPRLPAGPGHWTGSDGFDGVTLQWYRSLADFEAMIGDPDYQRIVGPDERYLLDLANSVYLLTEEPRTVVDGPARASRAASGGRGGPRSTRPAQEARGSS